MHIDSFIQDLAIIMIVAGLVTFIFFQLKQPVVLGYILSGVILGRHTPPFSFIHDEAIIKILAELGVIFLMFSLGLEFSIRKLFKVGHAAFIAALTEIIFMTYIGYEIGQFFGWKAIDSLFLGTMLAISSTTIIIKSLQELGLKRENFAQLIFGILILEDILAIGIIAILSGIAINGSLNLIDLATTFGKLLVFLVVSLIIGILMIPKILAYIAQFNNKEMLLITVLALCFGFSLLVIKLGYSIALGAFLIGAIIAESHRIKSIEKLIEPLTNMFSAIFFVSIGLLVDPKVMQLYWVSIIIITIALIIGKVLICSLSVFLSGHGGKTSMQVGMGLAQIGEFSFIIASLGISSKVMSPYLYPIIVAVSAITTFSTPYLIKIADPLTQMISKIIPNKILKIVNTYTIWLQNSRSDHQQVYIRQIIQKGCLQIFINLMLIMAIFIIGSYFVYHRTFISIFHHNKIERAILWGTALILSLPFLIAIYRKLKGISMLFVEITIKKKEKSTFKLNFRRALAEVIPVLGMVGVSLLITALSVPILPPVGLLLLVLMIVLVLTMILWRWLIKFHSKLQISLIDTFKKRNKK